MSSSSNSPASPAKRQVTLGSWIPSAARSTKLVQCPDNAHVTKLDFQSIRYSADYPDPYPAGLRLYCNGGAQTPQSLNWRTTVAEQGNVTTTLGVDVPDGVRDLIGSGDTYVQLLGYSTVIVGHAGSSSLWQQQFHKSEYAGCKLVGIEAQFVQWLDGARFHFACPPASADPGPGSSNPGVTPSCGSGAAAGSADQVSPFATVPLVVGMAFGCVGAVLVALVLTLLARRHAAGAGQQPDKVPLQPSPSSVATNHDHPAPPPAHPHAHVGMPSSSAPESSPALARAHAHMPSPLHASNRNSYASASLSLQSPVMYVVQQPPVASKKQVQAMEQAALAQHPEARGSRASVTSQLSRDDEELILP